MICSELRPIAQRDIITKWQIILKAEELARKELGPGAISWQVVDKAQDPKILEKAQEEYHKQKQAKQQSNAVSSLPSHRAHCQIASQAPPRADRRAPLAPGFCS
jgi:hypothetical protein